jgi:actin-related protein
MKEKLCYVGFDYESELKKAHKSNEFDRSYELPDSRMVTIGNKRFKCPELLFNPTLNKIDCDGIHQTLINSINKCDLSV